MEGEPNLSLLGSLELPDFDGAFWFDKLDDIGIGELPGEALTTTAALAAPMSASPAIIDQEEVPLPKEDSHDHDTDSNPDAFEPVREASPPSQKRRRGRGRAKSNLSVDDRRLKNREIQARYRAKQKREKGELEATYNKVSEELEIARKEQVVAQHTNEIMEKVLVLRDATVGILAKGSKQPSSTSKNTQESFGNHNRVIKEMKNCDTICSTGSGSGSGLPRPVVQHVFEDLSKDAGIPLRSIVEAYDAGKKLDETENVEEIAAKNPHYHELVSTVRNMTGHQLIEGWRTFALQLKHVINAYEEEFSQGGGTGATRPPASVLWDTTGIPKVMEQIKPLFEEQVTILSTAFRHNLPAVQALFSTAGQVGPDPVSYWNNIAEKMEITPTQRESFISLWNAYVSRVASLKEKRNDVVKSLIQASGLHTDLSPTNEPLPVDTLSLMMRQYCTLFDATGNVAATPDNEFTAVLDLMRDAGKVWSIFQKAKITALSYPAFPDIVLFLKSVASQKGQDIDVNAVLPMLEQGIEVP